MPIACTLTATQAEDRVEEWRRFLQASVTAVEHDELSARLRLRDGDHVLLAAADLSRRERACCAFFRFRIEPMPDALWLQVEVPPDAAPILDDFLGLAPDG